MSTKVMKENESIVVNCPTCGENLFDARLLVIDEYPCPYCGSGASITVKNGNLNIRKIDHRNMTKSRGKIIAAYAKSISAASN